MAKSTTAAQLIDEIALKANPGVSIEALQDFWKALEPLRSAGILDNGGYRLETPLGGRQEPSQSQEVFLNFALGPARRT